MLDGYPTLQPIGTSGQEIGAAVRRGGSYRISDPGPHPVILAPGSTAYFGYGWTDVTPPSFTTVGCVDTVGAESTPSGSRSALESIAQLPSVCPGSHPSVTSVALAPASATSGLAKP
jgi:Domain of unknown function (DUF4232)